MSKELDAFLDRIVAKRKLAEKLQTLGGKLFPGQNQILILAGDASSKKEIVNNFISFEGKVFNVDPDDQVLKSAQKGFLGALNDKFMQESQYALTDLKIMDAVERQWALSFLEENNFTDKQIDFFYDQRIATVNSKDNFIFELTLNNIENSLNEIANYCDLGGYEIKNRHLVWLLSSTFTPQQLDAKLSDLEDTKMEFTSQQGNLISLDEILTLSHKYQERLNGDIFLILNKNPEGDASQIENFAVIKFKEQNLPLKLLEEVRAEILEKSCKNP